MEDNFLVPKAYTSSLQLVGTNYALRCDAKYADTVVLTVERKVRAGAFFQLGDFLPLPFTKNSQPVYLDQPTEDSVPVVNTLSIRNLSIRVDDCRHVSRDDFESLSHERQLTKNDVVLTVDGGVSIGKPALFDKTDPFTSDSHVVILRPVGLGALALVYLLASPLAQMQFRRAESGASGQTTVTEDDIRRFIFPAALLETIDKIAIGIEAERKHIALERQKLDAKEASLWKKLDHFSS